MADPEDPNEYIVEAGDRLTSIAHAAGLDPKTIWDHPENADLKKKREHHEILMPGDRVFLPDKAPEQLAAKPKELNHYEVETIPSEIAIHILSAGEPLPAGKKCEVIIEGESKGTIETKDEGLVKLYVEPDVTLVTLRFDDPPFDYELLVGHLDPIDEAGGVEQRLINLGYVCPPAPPSLPRGSKAEQKALEKHERLRGQAIRCFQADAGLPVTGVLDDPTRRKLDEWTQEPGRPDEQDEPAA